MYSTVYSYFQKFSMRTDVLRIRTHVFIQKIMYLLSPQLQLQSGSAANILILPLLRVSLSLTTPIKRLITHLSGAAVSEQSNRVVGAAPLLSPRCSRASDFLEADPQQLRRLVCSFPVQLAANRFLICHVCK